MPRISEFYGIVVRMYYDEAHHRGRPHFHADYAGRAATVEIATGRVLAGSLPPAQRRLVRRWAAAHRRELEANWQRAREEQPLESIAPLA
jgi:Domain of unknown function (DUF4160)